MPLGGAADPMTAKEKNESVAEAETQRWDLAVVDEGVVQPR